MKCKNINDFFENITDTIEVVEFNPKFDNIISQIYIDIKNKNVKNLLSILKNILSESTLDLPHPDYPNIMTRARFSAANVGQNYILFTDNLNNHPWILAQSMSMIDFMITDKVYLCSPRPVVPNLSVHLRKIKEKYNKIGLAEYTESFLAGLLLGTNRPYHFFYDQYKYLCYLVENNLIPIDKNIVTNVDPFYSLLPLKKESTPYCDKNIYLKLTVLAQGLSGANHSFFSKKLMEDMEKFLLEDSIKELSNAKKTFFSLSIWIGITGQNRSWNEQVLGYIQILNKLASFYQTVLVLVDGLTSSINKTIDNSEDDDIFKAISLELDDNITVKSTIGLTYKHKIQLCNDVDVFIANAGSGSLVPLRFCKKPGVLHSNRTLFAFPDIYENIILIDKYFITEVPDANRGLDKINYNIKWEYIYQCLSEIIKKIRHEQLPVVALPMVDINTYFLLLPPKIDSTKRPFEILREVSLAFEKSGDIHTALTIMRKAQLLSPYRGIFIEKKINDYAKVIDETKEEV